MRHKTQNDHFIISYFKFLDFWYIWYIFRYIIFGTFITSFVILLIFLKKIYLPTQKKKTQKHVIR